MGSHALALFVESGGSFDAEGEFSEANMREAFGVEEGEMLTYPLAIMPPSSITSEGTSLRSTARTKVAAHKTAAPRKTARDDAPPTTANKKKAPVDPYVVTPSGSLDSRFLSSGSTARSDPSYTVVGIRKPGGGCGKGLMRKPPLAPPAPAPAPKTAATTSSAPLRIKRANPATGGRSNRLPSDSNLPSAAPRVPKRKRENPILRGQPHGFLSDSDNESKRESARTIAALRTSVRSLRGVVEELKGKLANTRLKYIELKDDLAAVQFGLTNRLVKVARAAGVEHVLDTNRI